LLIAALLVASKTCFADCDCLIIPFPKSCAKECMGKVLAKADYIQLRESLGLSPSTSRKIFYFPDKEKVKSVDAYAMVLNGQEMIEVKDKLSKIDGRTVASIFQQGETITTSPRR
jgi:hypothetical protein